MCGNPDCGVLGYWQLHVRCTTNRLSQLIVIIVDISSVSVSTGVTWADGGILIIVVLTPLVTGASLVHPV